MEIRANKTDQIKIGNRFENISDLDIHTIDLVQGEHNGRILRRVKRVKEKEVIVSKLKSAYLKLQAKLLEAELELAKEQRTESFLKVIGTKLRVKKESLKHGREISIN